MEATTETGSSHHHSGVGAAVKAVGGSSTALSQEFQKFVSDIEVLINSTASLSGEQLEMAKEKIQERIVTAKATLDSATQSVVKRGRAAVAATHKYLTEEPWKALGLGTASGFLLGLLFSRRRGG